jgi:ceramide glucosyltransferase
VTVIVPFRGADADLESGVRGLCSQTYPNYKLLLVVDSQTDPAFPVLTRVAAEAALPGAGRAEVLVAGPAGKHEGQKVHNQLFALRGIYEAAPDDEVWVFADSDAVPGPQWLRSLMLPLRQVKSTGLTTGYRWIFPERPGLREGLWSHAASLMNSSVAVLLGKDEMNHAWGGSMAIRAGTARAGDLRGLLEGALCDDYQFSRSCRSLGKRIYFVPQCLVATPVDFTWKSLVNFVHRQYFLTRIYAPSLFLLGLLFTSLYVAGFWSLVGYLLWCAIQGFRGMTWVWPVSFLAAAFLANQVRSWFRRRIVRRVFGEEGLAKLRTTLTLDRWATPLWMTLHWLLVVYSAFGHTMNWRGIRYRLTGPQKCERLD